MNDANINFDSTGKALGRYGWFKPDHANVCAPTADDQVEVGICAAIPSNLGILFTLSPTDAQRLGYQMIYAAAQVRLTPDSGKTGCGHKAHGDPNGR